MKRLLLLSLLAIPALGMDAPLPAKAANQAQNQEETECTICADNITGGQTYSKTPCGHVYHYNCFNQFSLSQARYSCPNCRGGLTDTDLALLRNAPSGTVQASIAPQGPLMAQAPAGFFDRVANVFSPQLPVVPVPEITQKLMDNSKQIKDLNKAKQNLASEKQVLIVNGQRLEESLRSEIARLINKNKALQEQLDTQAQSFEVRLQKILKSNPELAHVEALKNSIRTLGQEKEKLQQENKRFHAIITDLQYQSRASQEERERIITDANRIIADWKADYEKAEKLLQESIKRHDLLNRRYVDLETGYNRKARSALIYEERLSTLRQRLVNLSSWGIAALSGYLAYKYVPHHPKTAAFFAGATSLIGSYVFGSRYIHKCHLQDLRQIQN